MKIGKLLLLVCAFVVPISLAGCTSEKTDTAGHEEGHDHDHEGHSHEESGPHGGHLIELGEEAYHLEWAHDDGTLTFYVLDGAAKEEVKIPAENLQINVTVEGETKSWDVPAVRAEGEDTTAKFETKDESLFALVNDDETKATVDVEIEGKPYQGAIEHHHHGHSH
ncbi:hypothetical protein [Blastopirellula marina]|uniref:Uncharacterized protein n=1 Tax=Blastopirellula marina TaxID=124 RepID=A0A2S8F8M7_9BACT|nr:hypothetical protein [Blastopirellula marina]PQO28274.1 hypothetical protein C5Y98_25600 [Blastopirellula marina]PTL41814.1 hypothetical protein C5Y97_25615 [Blastopirellula marina]